MRIETNGLNKKMDSFLLDLYYGSISYEIEGSEIIIDDAENEGELEKLLNKYGLVIPNSSRERHIEELCGKYNSISFVKKEGDRIIFQKVPYKRKYRLIYNEQQIYYGTLEEIEEFLKTILKMAEIKNKTLGEKNGRKKES